MLIVNQEGYHLGKHTMSIITANKTQGPNAVLQLMGNNITGNISRGIRIKTAMMVLLPGMEVLLDSMSIFRVLFRVLML